MPPLEADPGAGRFRPPINSNNSGRASPVSSAHSTLTDSSDLSEISSSNTSDIPTTPRANTVIIVQHVFLVLIAWFLLSLVTELRDPRGRLFWMCASHHPPAITTALPNACNAAGITTAGITTITTAASITTITTAAGTTTTTITVTTTTTATPTATPMLGTDGEEIFCPNRPADFDWIYIATDPLRAFNATPPSKAPPPADERDACLKMVSRAIKRFARHWHPDKAAIHPLHLTTDQLTAISQHINKGREIAEADCNGEPRPVDGQAQPPADTGYGGGGGGGGGGRGGGGESDDEGDDDGLELDLYLTFGLPWSWEPIWISYEVDRRHGLPVGRYWLYWNAQQVQYRLLKGPSEREKAFWRGWKRVNKCWEKEQPVGQYFDYWYQHGIYWRSHRLKQAYPYGWAPVWEMPPGVLQSILLKLQSFIGDLLDTF